MELRLEIEETLVKAIGYNQLESALKEYVTKLYLRSVADELLEDLQTIDMENDKDWQLARNLAWEQEKHKYITLK